MVSRGLKNPFSSLGGIKSIGGEKEFVFVSRVCLRLDEVSGVISWSGGGSVKVLLSF